METKRKKELVKLIRRGVRLDTRPPKVEVPKSAYRRKDKHKRRVSDESSFFSVETLFQWIPDSAGSPCRQSSHFENAAAIIRRKPFISHSLKRQASAQKSIFIVKS